MPDLDMSVLVSRAQLGLADLAINDHLSYACAPQFLGGTIAWTRQQATSPFLDGAVTTSRTRQMVTETVAVEIYADTALDLRTRTADLIDAFTQSSFHLSVSLGAANYYYSCEAADVTMVWTGARLMSHQGQVVFAVPRSPITSARV